MRKRTKNALIAFAVLVIAFGVLFSFDYTDTSVNDFFQKTLTSRHYKHSEAFSLDAFLEYYDGDTVCVVLREDNRSFEDMLGQTIPLATQTDNVWDLLLLSSVNAKSSIDQTSLKYTTDMNTQCFDQMVHNSQF